MENQIFQDVNIVGIINAQGIGETLKSLLVDIFHPVETHHEQKYGEPTPAELFGGTWVIDNDYAGRVVIGSGTGYNLGDIGGETTHTLTVEEMPNHYHSFIIRVYATGFSDWNVALSNDGGHEENKNTTAIGGSQPHNNMQPYKVQNVWKRIA